MYSYLAKTPSSKRS